MHVLCASHFCDAFLPRVSPSFVPIYIANQHINILGLTRLLLSSYAAALTITCVFLSHDTNFAFAASLSDHHSVSLSLLPVCIAAGVLPHHYSKPYTHNFSHTLLCIGTGCFRTSALSVPRPAAGTVASSMQTTHAADFYSHILQRWSSYRTLRLSRTGFWRFCDSYFHVEIMDFCQRIGNLSFHIL